MALLLLPLLGGGLRAEVVLAPLFSDGAVLQCDKPVPVWGTADAREPVIVTFRGQACAATAGADGRWSVLLEPLAASAESADLTVSGRKQVVVVHDVVVGEVWLCSGQSNMEFTVSRVVNAPQEIAAAHFPLLRHIKIERHQSDTPSDRAPTSGWKAATPENVGAFTAVGYFFGRDIHTKVGVPIGLVHSSWGGTPIESWMSEMALGSDPAFAVVNERWQQAVADYPRLKAEFDANLPAWNAADAAAKARGPAAHFEWQRNNPKPPTPRGPGDQWTPSSLYNGMINPLVPYALRGVLWYQGESNAPRASEYQALFKAMITAWRTHFGQDDIPFYWVNLAGFRPPADRTEVTYAFLREAQTKTLALPNTGQAVAIDIGDPSDIHPTNKQEVGRRLALLARHRVYGILGDDTGPTFLAAEREGSAMRVKFLYVNSGLVAHDRPPDALQISGPDRIFYPATGRIEKNTLIVAAPNVKDPVAVRYAWYNAPAANLYSGSGLPVVPFRSDDW